MTITKEDLLKFDKAMSNLGFQILIETPYGYIGFTNDNGEIYCCNFGKTKEPSEQAEKTYWIRPLTGEVVQLCTRLATKYTSYYISDEDYQLIDTRYNRN